MGASRKPKNAVAKPANEARHVLGRARPEAAFPVASTAANMPRGYAKVLADLKEKIQSERLKTVLAASSAMVLLYWDIGRTILDRQEQEGWGSKIIDRLAADLRRAFPDMKGFSPRNLKYMRAFAAAWPDAKIVQQVVAQLPWGHIIRLLQRVKEPQAREWCIHKASEHGWSRAILELQIDGRAHERTSKAISRLPTIEELEKEFGNAT